MAERTGGGAMADGWQLNLYPPGWDDLDWSDFRHREAVLSWFREQLSRDGLAWDVVEFDDHGVRWTTWVCPEDQECWLCFETLVSGDVLEIVQASFPAQDNAWAARLAWAVVQAICRYQLVVEA